MWKYMMLISSLVPFYSWVHWGLGRLSNLFWITCSEIKKQEFLLVSSSQLASVNTSEWPSLLGTAEGGGSPARGSLDGGSYSGIHCNPFKSNDFWCPASFCFEELFLSGSLSQVSFLGAVTQTQVWGLRLHLPLRAHPLLDKDELLSIPASLSLFFKNYFILFVYF